MQHFYLNEFANFIVRPRTTPISPVCSLGFLNKIRKVLILPMRDACSTHLIFLNNTCMVKTANQKLLIMHVFSMLPLNCSLGQNILLSTSNALSQRRCCTPYIDLNSVLNHHSHMITWRRLFWHTNLSDDFLLSCNSGSISTLWTPNQRLILLHWIRIYKSLFKLPRNRSQCKSANSVQSNSLFT
jgi:hypothetical protein